MKELTLYLDGASRGNPGPSGIGVAIYEKDKVVKELSTYIGEGSNNIAEYSALIHGLKEALRLGAARVRLRLDSELVVHQLKGEYRVKSADIRPLFEEVAKLINQFEKVEVQHIDREQNKLADKLANTAINLAPFEKKVL